MKTFEKIPNLDRFIHDMRKYNSNASLVFNGTIKIHGTNGGIHIKDGKIYPQSRSQILSEQNDNYGFYKFCKKNEETILNMFADYDDIIVFGEFAGKGVLQGVAISKLDKAFYIFNVYDIKQEKYIYIDSDYMITSPPIYDIRDFGKYHVDIDFSSRESIEKAKEDVTKWVDEIEKECPVAKSFGVSGVGEGIVFQSGEYFFKAKGEKHSVVDKVAKQKLEISSEVLDFIDYVVTEQRIEQIMKEVEPLIENTGKFIKMFVNDCITEEGYLIEEKDLDHKQVKKTLSSRVAQIFKARIK